MSFWDPSFTAVSRYAKALWQKCTVGTALESNLDQTTVEARFILTVTVTKGSETKSGGAATADVGQNKHAAPLTHPPMRINI